MIHKNSILWTVTAGVFWLSAANAAEVATLRPEDEALLAEPQVTPQKLPIEKAVHPVSAAYTLSPNKPRKIEWFNPDELPTKRAVKEKADPQIAEFRTAINDCKKIRQQQLDLERDMLEAENTAQNAAYLSQTIQDINLCYEDIGREILETYYADDDTAFKRFEKKVKTFYVNGTNASFDPNFCGETCSMQAIIDAQMVKFAEFRIYLTKLLEERPNRK